VYQEIMSNNNMTLVVDDKLADGEQSWPMDSDDDDDTLSLQNGGDSLDGVSLTSSNMGSVKVLFTDQLQALHLLLDSPENPTPASLARGRFPSFDDEDSLDSNTRNVLLRDELDVADAAASLSTLVWRAQQAVSTTPTLHKQEQHRQEHHDQEQYWDDDSDDEETISIYSSSLCDSEEFSSSSSSSWGGDTTEGTPSACDISSSCSNELPSCEKKRGILGHVSLNDHHTMYQNDSPNFLTKQQTHVSPQKWACRFLCITALCIAAVLFRLAGIGGVLFINSSNGHLIATSASHLDAVALPQQQNEDYCAPLLPDSVIYRTTASWMEVGRGDTTMHDIASLEFVKENQENPKKFSEHHVGASSKVHSRSNTTSKCNHANAVWCAIQQGISRRPRRARQSSVDQTSIPHDKKDEQEERAPVLSGTTRRALIARAFL
jgi:hypothetical protein